jgi:endoglucanase
MLLVPGAALYGANPGAGYWHTSGNKILDSNNQTVRIAGINWYGFETTDEVVHGLTDQDYKSILQAIETNGYNTVRIPYSSQMVESPVIPSAISYSNANGPINTDLQGLNSLQIMDVVIQYAGSIGLRVILDNHRSEAGNSAEASGLWYTSAYPETSWISDWQALATRYANNSTVIGMDLRDEPHNAATGGACWDCGGAIDWHLAAERAGNAILAINPSLLIFVEGTDEYNNNYYFWGGNLQGVQTSPVQLSVANHLVYSAHDYGPVESAQAWFNSSTTYDSLVSTWTSYWAYISLNGIAPVWVGEFGTTNTAADLESSTSGSQGQWFSSLVQFLGANPNLSWTYWALNGEDNYALLDSSYDPTPASAMKQQMLAQVQFPLGGSTPITSPSFTLSQNPATIVAASSATDTGSSGNTTEVIYTALVNNRTSSSETGVSVTLSLPSTAVVVSEAGTGSGASCSGSPASYACSFSSIAASANGGVTATVIYPASGLTFNSSGQATVTVNSTASVGTTALPAASAMTTVDKQGQPDQTVSLVATPSPGYTFTYGTQPVVNFVVTPTPSNSIPLSSFSAQLDGSQTLTVTAAGSNQYQIPIGLLSAGQHTVTIQMAASSSYLAATSNVVLTVLKASITASAGSPSGTYGAAIPVSLAVNGLSGTGYPAPTGTVILTVDGNTPTTATIANGVANFNVAPGVTATTHSLTFTYSGDNTYGSQTIDGSLTVKLADLVATAAAASRAFGAANPIFTGTLTGVVNNDGITAGYTSQANATTAAGVYSSGTNAITPVLADPNNRLSNYNVTLNDGALTITGSGGSGGASQITLSSNPTSLSLGLGQSTAVKLSMISSSGFTGTVSFACTGLPNGSTCAFSPASITGSGSTAAQSTTLTIGLPAAGTSALREGEDGRYLAGIFALPAGLLGLLLLRQRKRLYRSLAIWVLAAVFLVSAGIGCGAGNSNSGGATPVGSYNALITATTAGSSTTLTIPVTLTQ